MNDNRSNDIAIIGMACVLPGAPDARRYWENILHKVNAISDAPPEWEAELFYEQDTKADDRTYCKRGGFLGKLAQFDPFSFGIMPNAVDGGEPDHYMALQTAHDALKDCGKLDLEPVKQRTAVIVGRGTYVNRGNAAALQQGVMVDSILRILKQLHPEHTDAELAEIKRQIKAGLAPFHSDTAAGLVPNIISGRIANRLDLMGPNYLIDAACASSLAAIEMAAREIQTGRCDLAIAGGVNSNTSPHQPNLTSSPSGTPSEHKATYIGPLRNLRIERYQGQTGRVSEGAQVRVSPKVRRCRPAQREGVPQLGKLDRLCQVPNSPV